MTPSTANRAHLVERAAEIMARPTPAVSGETPSVLSTPSASHARRYAAPIALADLHAAGMIPSSPAVGRSRAQEELAMVEHQVLRMVDEASHMGSPRKRIVLVASALPHEGKTFTALNLAAGIATRGARPALLIDVDGRDGSISTLLGADGRPGLRELIASPNGRGAEFILPTALDRLSLLPHGALRDGEQILQPGGTAAAAIQRLAAALPDHVIVLDPPPCLSTSDCAALAAIAGQVVLVVEAERTARDEVEAALDVLEACPNLQLLLNRVRLTSSDTFGAHGSYGAPADA